MSTLGDRVLEKLNWHREKAVEKGDVAEIREIDERIKTLQFLRSLPRPVPPEEGTLLDDGGSEGEW